MMVTVLLCVGSLDLSGVESTDLVAVDTQRRDAAHVPAM